MSTPAITGFAHRGAPRRRVEHNTLDAFARALAMGARGLESDIGLTADGIPVLAHVALPLLGGVRVSHVRRDELPPSVPALEDLYRRCGTDFDLALDMAAPDAAAAVMAIAQAHGATDRLWLTYWRVPQLRAWRATWPDAHLVFPTIPTGPRRTARTLDQLAEIGVDAVNIVHWLCTERLVAHAHGHGLRAFAWGIKRRGALQRVLHHGIDGVFCDNVADMVELVATR